MSRLALIERNKKRIKLHNKLYEKRKELTIELKHNLKFCTDFILFKKIQKLPRNSSKTRLRNRCTITGRSRGSFKYYGFSRHFIKELSKDSSIAGSRKLSW